MNEGMEKVSVEQRTFRRGTTLVCCRESTEGRSISISQFWFVRFELEGKDMEGLVVFQLETDLLQRWRIDSSWLLLAAQTTSMHFRKQNKQWSGLPAREMSSSFNWNLTISPTWLSKSSYFVSASQTEGSYSVIFLTYSSPAVAQPLIPPSRAKLSILVSFWSWM